MVEQPNLKLIYSTEAPSQKTHRELKLSSQLHPTCLPEKKLRKKGKASKALCCRSSHELTDSERGKEQYSKIRNPLRKCPASYSIPLKANSSHSINSLPHPKLLHREL